MRKTTLIFTINIMKMIRKNIKLLTLIVLSILYLTFCNNKHNENIYDIGDQLNPAHFSIINTYQVNGEVYKEVQHKTNPNSTFFIFGEKSRIFLYTESNVNSQRFKCYYDFFNNKFKENPTYIDSSMFSGNFICRKYLWNDSINHDFAILSSCKNINDTLTKLGINWDIEAGNDSLITKLQNIDE